MPARRGTRFSLLLRRDGGNEFSVAAGKNDCSEGCAGAGNRRDANAHRLVDERSALSLRVYDPPDVLFADPGRKHTADLDAATRPRGDLECRRNVAEVDDADVDAGEGNPARVDADDCQFARVLAGAHRVAPAEWRFHRRSSAMRDVGVAHDGDGRLSMMLDPQRSELAQSKIGPHHIGPPNRLTRSERQMPIDAGA